jgi:hypothetical protein
MSDWRGVRLLWRQSLVYNASYMRSNSTAAYLRSLRDCDLSLSIYQPCPFGQFRVKKLGHNTDGNAYFLAPFPDSERSVWTFSL